MDILECLPTELLQQILDHVNDQKDLHQCVFVCKPFYTALINKLWDSPTEHRRCSHCNVVTVTNCLRQAIHHSFHPTPLGHYIRKIIWRYNTLAEDFFLLLSLTPLVQDLHLEYKKIRNSTMEQIVYQCPRLQKLYLVSPIISNRSILFLVQHCRSLEDLSLYYCTRLDWRTFLALKDSGLKRLYIGGSEWLTTNHAAAYLGQLDHLTHLTLDYCWVRGNFIQRLASPLFLPRMTYFELQGLGRLDAPVTDQALIPLIASHPRLEFIRLVDSCQITDDSLLAMSKYLPGLRCLYLNFIQGISVHGVQQLIKGCCQLTYLAVHGCDLTLPRCEGEEESWLLDDLYEDDIKWIRSNMHLDFRVALPSKELIPCMITSPL